MACTSISPPFPHSHPSGVIGSGHNFLHFHASIGALSPSGQHFATLYLYYSDKLSQNVEREGYDVIENNTLFIGHPVRSTADRFTFSGAPPPAACVIHQRN